MRLREEAKAFGSRQASVAAQARQLAAMQLVCGIDLSMALDAGGDFKAGLVRRIERIIERERLKGMRRHWSYDLNRHIALKQVLDQLRGGGRAETPPESRKNQSATGNRKHKRRRWAP